MSFLTTIESTIAEQYQHLKRVPFLVALSGGVDSVVLTYILKKQNFDIAVAHVNFQLRGEDSEQDQKFVEHFAKENNLVLHLMTVDTKKYAEENHLSIQLAARKLRYDWFDELKEQHGYACLATAHHLNDDAETFLINFARGTGLSGLLGIRENDEIIRPLLPFSKQDILQYAKAHQLDWREDKSNASDKYTRNRIRHHVVPVLESINTQFLQSFVQTKAHLHQVNDILEDAIAGFENHCVHYAENEETHIDITKLKTYRNPQAFLYHFLKKYNFTAWEDIHQLVDAESGKQIFSSTHILLKDREKLIVKPDKLQQKEESYKINQGEERVFEPILLTLGIFEEKNPVTDKNQIVVDGDLLVFPLHIRRWQSGDYFYPYGMKGKKKLSKYFKDEKFTLFEKTATWILTDNNNQIIWIIGHRMDDRFKVTEKTEKQLQIKYIS